MQPLTPAQQKSLQGWTEQRDSLLAEIRNYSIQLEDLQKSTVTEGAALAALHVSIGEARGRLAELEAVETRWRGSVSTDISELEVRKTRLQGECSLLDEKLKGGNEKFEIITSAIGTLEAAHETMRDQSAIVNRVVGEIIQTSQAHTSDMKVTMAEVRTLALEVIDKSNANISQADLVLSKLALHIAERQKPIPVRRMYPSGHPKHVAALDGASTE